MTRPVPLSRRHFVKQAAAGGTALTPGNATRAFLEYAPMRFHSDEESERVFRHVPYERDLDIFVIDMRSSRAENSANGNGPCSVVNSRSRSKTFRALSFSTKLSPQKVVEQSPIGNCGKPSAHPLFCGPDVCFSDMVPLWARDFCVTNGVTSRDLVDDDNENMARDKPRGYRLDSPHERG